MNEERHPVGDAHIDARTLGSGLRPTQLWHYYRRYPFILSRLVLFIGVLAVIYVVLKSIESVVFPLLVSLFIAYLLDPVIDWFEAHGVRRTAAIGLFLGLGLWGVVGFLLILYPTISNEIASVSDKLPKLIGMIQHDAIPWFEAKTGYELPANFSTIMSEHSETLKKQVPILAKGASSWLISLWSKTGAIVTSALNLVMIPVFTFYFLRDFDKMRLATVDYIPRPHRDFILTRVEKMDAVVGAWFRGQIEVAAILAVLYAIGLGTVFGLMGVGVTAGISIGVLTGLLNIVPYLGFAIGFVLSVAMVLLEWTGWMPLIAVLAVFIGVQALEGYVITPRVVGEKVGLSPVVVIIVLLLGGEILGLVGVLLAIPIAGVLRVLLPDFLELYTSSPFYTGDLDTMEDAEE
jgi:predicted PurR-regulated permease PerM